MATSDPFKDVIDYQVLAETRPRYATLDLARGTAIVLMFLSHSVMAMAPSIPEYGHIPVHLITKFSSTLFFLVFGISLGLYFLKDCGTKKWPRKRRRLILRGLEIFLWYKVLTIIQLYGTRSKDVLIDSLFFKFFPDYVEVLGFYAFILMWLPLVLPLWKRLHSVLKIALTAAFMLGGNWLHYNYDFGGYDALKTILVEFEGRFTFGQLQRGATVFLGLILADILIYSRQKRGSDFTFQITVLFLGIISFGVFGIVTNGHFMPALKAVAANIGKHPPNIEFMAFSTGGAMLILFFFQSTQWVSRFLLYPIMIIGRHSLFSFCFHIVVIFVLLRNILELRTKLSYTETIHCFLGLTLAAFLISVMLEGVKYWGSSNDH